MAFKAKQKFLSLFLIVCLAMPVGLFLISINVQLAEIKQQAKKNICQHTNPEEFLVLKFGYSQAQQLQFENKDEFEYGGEMFDVVTQTITKDSVFFICYKDNKESILKYKIENLSYSIWQQNQTKQRMQVHFFNLLFSCFVEPNNEIFFDFLETKPLFKKYKSQLITQRAEEIFLPPKLA